MNKFVVHSDNRALINAFYDTCLGLGMPVNVKWNINHRDKSYAKYILFDQREEIEFHSHDCTAPILNLPAQWNEALEAAKAIYLKPKYTGIWKVGDSLSESLLNHKSTVLWDCDMKWEYGNDDADADDFWCSRVIEEIDYKDGKWAALISGTAGVWVEIASLPDLKQMELDEAVKQSGLKIGDKGVFDGLTYSTSIWEYGATSIFVDSKEYYEVSGFEYYNNKPCAKVICPGELAGVKYYFTLDQFEAVQIGVYEAKVEDGKIAFGCQQFTKEELQAICKLFNPEIDATIQIRGVDITNHMLARLIAKL